LLQLLHLLLVGMQRMGRHQAGKDRQRDDDQIP
jgi:hypothetical protein